MVPVVKAQEASLDGRGRQVVIRAAWRRLDEASKFTYVLMSRLDRERALYHMKLLHIKEDYLAHLPQVQPASAPAAVPLS